MRSDDDREPGTSETPPDESATAASPTSPTWTPASPSPWQPIEPSGWQPQQGWQQPQQSWPPTPSWPPQPSSGAGQPPQAPGGWGMPPGGYGAPRRPSRLPQVIAVLGACLIAFSGGLLLDHSYFPNTTQSTSGQGPGRTAAPSSSTTGSSLYDEALQIVKQNYVGRSNITDEQLVTGSISGMVDSLGDTGHSYYLSAADYAALQNSLNGSGIAGIGVLLSNDNGTFKVDRVISGSPAAAAGVKAGDEITAVDGVSTANMTFDQLGIRIRGTVGTDVTITVLHLGSSNPVDIRITRANITMPLAVWGIVPGTHVADISLSEFSDGAADQVQADISAAQAAGATSIVFDLRGNPGGLASEATGVASDFLSSGTVYVEQDARGNDHNVQVDGSRTHSSLPMVVLVNRDSASASEIVAGALQDHTRARIVGVNTFGTGTVTQPFQLSDGSVIILGTEWWLTPNGHRAFGVGITPDQVIQMTSTALPVDPTALADMTSAQLQASGDAQLLAAVTDLTS